MLSILTKLELSQFQAVVVRYASEVTKERDALLQHSAGLEAKWLTAECKNVILRQRIADILVHPSPLV